MERRYIGSVDQAPKKSYSIKILIALFVIGFLGRNYITSTGNIEVTPGNYSISSGESVGNIAKKFKIDVGDLRYKLYIKWYAPEVKLQTGTYSVGSGTTLETLFSKTLSSPPSSKEISITILPGWTVYDIENTLMQYNLVGTGEISKIDSALFAKLSKKYSFLQASSGSLEGFLYPDTYRFLVGGNLESTLSRFLDNFNKKIYSKYSNLSTKELYSTLILGSIVEKEERSETNRPVVAGILAKRIKEKMYLGADATICYPFWILYKECTPSFIVEHLEDDTPYNTRTHLGLPPTPITSPTFSAFSAAKNPETTQYYYYLHDNDGQIHYGVTLSDHNRNKVQYLGK